MPRRGDPEVLCGPIRQGEAERVQIGECGIQPSAHPRIAVHVRRGRHGLTLRAAHDERGVAEGHLPRGRGGGVRIEVERPFEVDAVVVDRHGAAGGAQRERPLAGVGGGGTVALERRRPRPRRGKAGLDLGERRELRHDAHPQRRRERVVDVGDDPHRLAHGAIAHHSFAEDSHLRVGGVVVEPAEQTAEHRRGCRARADRDPLGLGAVARDPQIADVAHIAVIDPVDRSGTEIARRVRPHLRRSPQHDDGVVQQRLERELRGL